MPSLDFEAVRKAVHLNHVLMHFAIDKGFQWDQFARGRGKCPLGCSDDPRCCSIDVLAQVWKCHRCQAGGGSLELYCAVTGKSYYDGAIAMCQAVGVPVPYQERSKIRKLRAPRKRKSSLDGTGEPGVN